MAGATAATAAGVTASQANAVTINLVNNYISFNGGNNLNADLTGDGHPDLTIANAHAGYGYYGYSEHFARVTLNGVEAAAFWREAGGGIQFFYGNVRLGGGRASYGRNYNHYNNTTSFSSGTHSLTGSIPIFFKDLHINGGAPTEGSLEVTVSVFDADQTVQLDSFTYNTPVQGSSRAVPDQGSTLALLALGAGGILALRRWRAAQGRS